VTKYLVLLAVVAAVIWFATAGARARARRTQAPQAPVQDMVRCAHCGVFQPKADSLAARGQFYCSAEHERLH
jgi:uncharacterized protein